MDPTTCNLLISRSVPCKAAAFCRHLVRYLRIPTDMFPNYPASSASCRNSWYTSSNRDTSNLPGYECPSRAAGLAGLSNRAPKPEKPDMVQQRRPKHQVPEYPCTGYR
eukprot:1479255-Rhodomonas_salina.1